MAASMSRGKRILKAGLEKQGWLKRRRVSPDEEANFYCRSGIDKDIFEVKYISDYKGFGVFTKEKLVLRDFLLQYVGEKISHAEALQREMKGAENMFFYTYKKQTFCLDAEGVDGHICQYVNDSPEKEANAIMKLKIYEGTEKLCLFAKRDISPGEEFMYNYGDDEKNLWWHKRKQVRMPTCQIYPFPLTVL